MTKLADKDNYRPDELAEILDVKIWTVWKWIREERVKAFHVGGLLRIPKSEFERVCRQGPLGRK